MGYTVDFFKDEVRHGFYVPTAIKQMWAAQLLVLEEIDRICQKYNIKYIADWGTFLGTVRHGGYVPWDDDFDICMRRDDYVRFREVADRELPSEFFIHDFEHKEGHWLFLSRVVNNSKISFNEGYLDKHFNYPYMAGIDIFIQDYLYRDPGKEKERDREIIYLITVADAIVAGDKEPEVIEYHLQEIEEKYGIGIDRKLDDRHKGIALYKLAEEQMMRVPYEEADEVGQIFPFILKGGVGRPKTDYEELVRLPFENTTMPVPSRYHELLKTRYGDYFQVRKIWTGHDYPYFERQRENLQKVADFKLPKYEFDRSVFDEKPELVRESNEYKEVLFVATGPERWRGQFSKLYDEIRDSEDTLVYVVALPILFKDPLGRIKATDEELILASRDEEYPENVVITPWYEYDVREHLPEIIYIQDVYDEENPCLTIPAGYYAGNLRNYTDRLIYIPPFDTDEFTAEDYNDIYNLKHYVLKPAFVYADTIYVQSAHLRDIYMDCLCEWAGEDTREYWDNKLKVRTDSIDGSAQQDAEEIKISKKKLLYLIGLNELAEHKDVVSEAIEQRLKLLEDNSDSLDVRVMYYPIDKSEWLGYNYELSERIFSIVDRCLSNEWCSLAEDPMECDAYYGSASPYALMFSHEGKPVMIADFSV